MLPQHHAGCAATGLSWLVFRTKTGVEVTTKGGSRAGHALKLDLDGLVREGATPRITDVRTGALRSVVSTLSYPASRSRGHCTAGCEATSERG